MAGVRGALGPSPRTEMQEADLQSHIDLYASSRWLRVGQRSEGAHMRATTGGMGARAGVGQFLLQKQARIGWGRKKERQ